MTRFFLFSVINPDNANVIKGVVEKKLTYLSLNSLSEIASAVTNNENNGIHGIIIEAGCALGGSAITIAKAKKKSRKFFVYDVFGMIPPHHKKMV